MIFDTHAHYDDHQYDSDREAVLASLSEYKVRALTNISADMESVQTTLDLAYRYEFIYAAVGVHPDGVPGLTEKDMETLKALVQEDRKRERPKIVAVGEIGLDYYWDDVPKETQIPWFIRQIELSEELDLPIVVHSRDAAKDTYDLLKTYKTGEGAGIIHCFSYSKEMARQFLDLGYYIALGGVTTFKNAKNAKEVAAYVPKDRLLLETDCPYMAPVPFRGKRNDSRLINHIVPVIAELRKETPEEIERQTFENALRLYRIRDLKVI